MAIQRRTSAASFAPTAGRRFGFQQPTTIGQPQTVNNFGFPMPMGDQEPTPLDFNPPPQAPPPTPQAPAQPALSDIMAKYNAAIGNRPNRMAYQDAVNAGQPQIERGKLAKLGAIIAAGATGFGSKDASAGYNLGMSAYNEPQRKSNEKWKEKMTGLGNLATMEDSDVNARLKGIDAERAEYYKNREDKRQETESTDKSALSALERKHVGMQMDELDTDKWTDADTGISYERNPQGVIKTVGKTKRTSTEENEDAITRGIGIKAGEFPMEMELQGLRNKGAAETARVSGGSRERVADINGQYRVQAASANLKGLLPDQKFDQLRNDLTLAFNEEGSNIYMLKPSDWIDTSSDYPTAVQPSWADNVFNKAEVQQIRATINSKIAESMNRSNKQPAGTIKPLIKNAPAGPAVASPKTPTAKLPEGFSIRNAQ